MGIKTPLLSLMLCLMHTPAFSAEILIDDYGDGTASKTNFDSAATIRTLTLTLTLTILLLILACSQAIASNASFSWLPNPETDVAGYIIHYGSKSGEYTEEVDVGMAEVAGDSLIATIQNVPDGNTYYALTVYSQDNESDYSKEVQHDPLRWQKWSVGPAIHTPGPGIWSN